MTNVIMVTTILTATLLMSPRIICSAWPDAGLVPLGRA